MNDIVCATAESDPSVPCLVDDLKTLDIPVLLGFVAAASGDFQYVDAVEIAKHARSRKEARDCLVGAALASSAMPVFLQQVRINKKAYYDGGVRESVFAARTVASAESARKAASGAPPSVPVYVVRNGPTRAAALAKDDASPDDHADALTAAMRAEPIIVNQIEVGSIAALRLEDPQGPVNLITADGWQNAKPACVKKPKVMFQPDFMQCLRSFGRARAMGAKGGWISLDPVSVAGPQK